MPDLATLASEHLSNRNSGDSIPTSHPGQFAGIGSTTGVVYALFT
jgi:hypothetical protein